MATLGAMKARIARETTRDDLLDNGAIAEEITSAINFYRAERFWFNEKRTQLLFNTVVGQTDYGAATAADIAHILRIDYVTASWPGDGAITVGYCSPLDMEILLSNPPLSAARPYRYSYYEQTLRLYPEPDRIYPVRVAGVFRVNPPATDVEAGNPWMTEAEELIRSRAKRNLYMNSMIGTEASQGTAMRALEEEALNRLKRETSSRTQVRHIRPTYL
jgi:hypothetical protein